jgi:hypothetical protein
MIRLPLDPSDWGKLAVAHLMQRAGVVGDISTLIVPLNSMGNAQSRPRESTRK